MALTMTDLAVICDLFIHWYPKGVLYQCQMQKNFINMLHTSIKFILFYG
jgi:hypothetical protein